MAGFPRSRHHNFSWDLKDNQGEYLSNGIYRLTITAISDDTIFYSYGDIEILR